MVPKTCAIEECARPIRARSLCTGHYAQRSKGKPFTPLGGHSLTVGMSTEDRFWFYVEKSAECWTYIGGKNADGYGSFSKDGASAEAHRVSWELTNGPIPDGIQIDHMCHNPACVKPAHLRFATISENQQNLRGVPRSNTSGVLGVHWHRDSKMWRATVKHKGKSKHLGYFNSINDAEAASVDARSRLFTHFQAPTIAAIRDALA